MRPRVSPRKTDVQNDVETANLAASMRPRVFPAEDRRPGAPWRRGPRRFNEAAGIPRGRLHQGVPTSNGRWSFNEAAGIPRGRRRRHP